MNLEKLLSQPPLKGRVVLGFDPGFYNGCKLAVLDETGKLVAVLMDGTEMKTTDPLYEDLLTGHNFRSR